MLHVSPNQGHLLGGISHKDYIYYIVVDKGLPHVWKLPFGFPVPDRT